MHPVRAQTGSGLPREAAEKGGGGGVTGGVTGLAAVLGVVTALLRLPFAARRLWDHDSVQFALGVEHFDLAAHHPHPPGYPVYIALLKALDAVGIEPLHGMVALSILASGLGAAFLALVAARLAEPFGARIVRAAALAAGVLYATNPLLWFYGELPLIYAVEAALATALAWGAVRLGEGPARGAAAFATAAALYALAAGIRPTTAVLLSPLLLFGLYRAWRRGGLTLGRLAIGGAVGVAVAAAWAVPFLAAAAGLAEYRRISGAHFTTLLPQTSVLYGAGFPALAHNLEVLTKWVLQAALPGVLALGLLLTWWAVREPSGLRRLVGGLSSYGLLAWLAVWILPPVAFFLLFHITKAGYTFVFLPGVLLALALGLAAMGSRRAAFGITLTVAALLGAGLFLFGADRRPEQPRLWALVRHEFNAAGIRTFEAELDQVRALVDAYPPDTALVALELAGGGGAGAEGFLYSWHRHLQWYFPQRTVVFLAPAEDLAQVVRGHGPWRTSPPEVRLPPETRRLLFVLSGPVGERLSLPMGILRHAGQEFRVLEAGLGEGVTLGPFRLGWQRLETPASEDPDAALARRRPAASP